MPVHRCHTCFQQKLTQVTSGESLVPHPDWSPLGLPHPRLLFGSYQEQEQEQAPIYTYHIILQICPFKTCGINAYGCRLQAAFLILQISLSQSMARQKKKKIR